MKNLLQHLPQLWITLTDFGQAIVHFVQTNSWLAPVVSIGVALLAVGRRVIRRFGQRVLTQLEAKLNPKADRLADRLVELPETFFSFRDFQNRYDQSLVYALRDFRVQGLKTRGAFVLDLQKVFVPLRVAPESVDKIPSAMIGAEDTSGNFSIWDFLAAIGTQPAFRRLVVLGPPGSGKSTLLERLTLTYAQHAPQHKQAPNLLPILVYLRDVREAIVSESIMLPALLEQQHRQINPPSGWFATRLQDGKCLVMLDGLDEVADTAQRQQVSRWVAQQMQTYPKCCFVLTSRPFGYKTAPLERVTSIEIKPFNLAQMRQFINNWYLQNEIMSRLGKDDPGVRRSAKTRADDLIDRIQHSPPLAVMALNPLLLTMIATVHSYRGALPGRRVELYAEICDVLLGRRQEAKGTPDKLTALQKQTVLQVLALKGMQRNTREFKLVTACLLIRQRLETVAGSGADPEQFIRSIENVSGLLVEREQGIYEFAHKSFQEYLAANQIKAIDQEMLLIRHVDDPWWEETIRLYAAQSDASYLIRAAIDRNTVGALTIAYDCLEEGLSVDPKIRQALETTLEKGLESTDPDIFKLAAEVKLSRRLKNLLRIDENTEIDMSYITCAEYQLFINEKQLVGENRQPDHWTSYQFTPGDANQPIAGVRASDAIEFCEWLTVRSSVLGDTYLEGDSVVSVGEVCFRLPVLSEVQEYFISTGQVGCWSKAENEMTVAGIAPDQLQTWQQKLVNFLNADLKLGLDLDRVCALILDLDLAPNCTYRVLDLDHTRVINRALDHAFILAIDRKLDFDRTCVIALDFVRARALTCRQDLVLTINRNLGNSSGSGSSLEAIRIYLGFASVTWNVLADAYRKAARDRGLLKSGGLTRKECEEQSLECVARSAEASKFYVFFALLIERRSQRLPAWESIQIVRERVKRE